MGRPGLCVVGAALCFDAFYVAAVAGIDAYFVADVDEEGYSYFGTGFYSCGLEGVGGGVAFDAGLGVCDFENDACGHFAGEHGFGSSVNHCFADVAVLEEFNAFDAFAGDDDFFPSFGMEEVVAHVVLVGELVGATLDAYFVDLHTRVPGLVEDAAGLDVAQLGANESGAFAGFNVEEFFDEIVGAVDVEAHTVFKISSCCHKRYMRAFFVLSWLLRAQNYKISAECPSIQPKKLTADAS